MKILAVAFRKGGVGKTTLTFHLAHALAEQGKRVLLIDTDENDLAQVFDTPADGYPLLASHLFTDESLPSPSKVAPNIWLIPADPGVLDVDDLPIDALPDLRARLTNRFATEFDVVIIDTPPNLQCRLISALSAADAVVAPFSISTFSLHRMPRFLDNVAHIQASRNPALRMIGIVPFLVNSKSANEVSAIEYLQQEHGQLLIAHPVTIRACVPTVMNDYKPVWRSARSGNQRVAAGEMRAACTEITQRLFA